MLHELEHAASMSANDPTRTWAISEVVKGTRYRLHGRVDLDQTFLDRVYLYFSRLGAGGRVISFGGRYVCEAIDYERLARSPWRLPVV